MARIITQLFIQVNITIIGGIKMNYLFFLKILHFYQQSPTNVMKNKVFD